jgi:hypothetical protein
MAKLKKTVVDPLFIHAPPSVRKLADTAAKGIRENERAQWWAKNKPAR